MKKTIAITTTVAAVALTGLVATCNNIIDLMVSTGFRFTVQERIEAILNLIF